MRLVGWLAHRHGNEAVHRVVAHDQRVYCRGIYGLFLVIIFFQLQRIRPRLTYAVCQFGHLCVSASKAKQDTHDAVTARQGCCVSC
jgi:hypothetical protein